MISEVSRNHNAPDHNAPDAYASQILELALIRYIAITLASRGARCIVCKINNDDLASDLAT